MTGKQKTIAERFADNPNGTALASLAFRIEDVLKENGFLRSCLGCDHHKLTAPYVCGKWKQQVPPKVFVVGCPDYTDDETIPF